MVFYAYLDIRKNSVLKRKEVNNIHLANIAKQTFMFAV